MLVRRAARIQTSKAMHAKRIGGCLLGAGHPVTVRAGLSHPTQLMPHQLAAGQPSRVRKRVAEGGLACWGLQFVSGQHQGLVVSSAGCSRRH
jgi:hypothetical protein